MRLPSIGHKRCYTEDEIGRVPCFKCKSRPAKEQFKICALGGRYVPVCPECDVELKTLVLDWLDVPEKDERIQRYKEKMLAPGERSGG